MTLIFNSLSLEIYETLNSGILSFDIRTDEYTHNNNHPSVLSEESIKISLHNKMITIRRTTSSTSSRTNQYENISLQSIPYDNIENIILDLNLETNSNYKSSLVRFLFLQSGQVVHEFKFSIQLLHIPKEDLPKVEQVMQNIHENLVREIITPVSNMI